MVWIVALVQGILFGYACSYIAKAKGRDSEKWAIIGFVFGIVGLFIIAVLKGTDQTVNLPIIQDTTVVQFRRKSEAKSKVESIIRREFLLDKIEPNMQTNLKSPIDIIGNHISMSDDVPTLLFRFRNQSNKVVKSILFEVECLNSFGKPVNEMKGHVFEKIVQDLEIKPGLVIDEMLTTELLEYLSTRKSNIIVKKVLYSDGVIWAYNTLDQEQNQIEVISDLELLENARSIFGADIISFGAISDHKWVCICGKNNGIEAQYCTRCTRKKQSIMDDFLGENFVLTVKTRMENIRQSRIEIKEIHEKELLEAKQKSELERIRMIKENRILRKRKTKKIVISLSVLLVSIACFLGALFYVNLIIKYNRATTLLKENAYELAEELFTDLGNYKDSENLLVESQYGYGKSLMDSKDFKQAIELFTDLGNYKDSDTLVLESKYGYGKSLMDIRDYKQAIERFTELGTFEDSEGLVVESNYLYGKLLMDIKDYVNAIESFTELDAYKNSKDLLIESTYQNGVSLTDKGYFEEAKEIFEALGTYRDSEKYYLMTIYNIGFYEIWPKGNLGSEFSRIFGTYKFYTQFYDLSRRLIELGHLQEAKLILDYVDENKEKFISEGVNLSDLEENLKKVQ
jgi:tetratricopeptide (TPR) repeat protein